MAISTGTQNEWSSSGAASASTSSRDTEDGLLPVIKFLQNALAMKARGDGLHYQTLVLQLISRDDPSTLWRLYLGMCHCVTIISQDPDEFKELIDAVFRFDWRGDDKVVGAFSTFVSHLVSANSTYMLPAMHMLVRSLVLGPGDLDKEGNVDPQALTRQRRVHETLQATLNLVPSGRSKLVNLLTRNYPHRRLRAETLSDFTLQALRVVQYAPLIEDRVVRLILERSLEMDVEIKITDTGEAVVDDEDESDALFAMDDVPDGLVDKQTPERDEANEMAEKLDGIMLVIFTYLDQRLTANVSLAAEVILGSSTSDNGGDGDGDVVGSAVGQHEPGSGNRRGGDRRKRRSSTGKQGIDMEPVAKLLQSLLLVFEERILPTHRSKFVQFVLFFACGRAPGLGHAFSSKLLDVLLDESKPKLTRQSSVAYLASFLGRGLFLEASLVSKALGTLLRWATDYVDRHDDAVGMLAPGDAAGGKALETPVGNRMRSRAQSWNGATPEPLCVTMNANGDRSVAAPMSALAGKSGAARGADHTLFYSICQATFYVMCFRGNELAATDGIAHQVVMWRRLLTCSLQPLRHCLDTVRREFSRLCVGLLEEYLPDELFENLESIAEERPIQSQPISVGASLSFSSPRSSASNGKAWTPSRVTRAGGLGQGWWDPLYSFFPFDPYLLRRSHVYVDPMYNTWKATEYRKSNCERSRRHARTPGDDRSDIDSDSDSDGELDAMDASSLSYGDRAHGLESRSRRMKRSGGRDRSDPGKRPLHDLDGAHRESSWGSFITDGESVVSRLSVDTGAGFAESNMSVASGSSVAVGSLVSGGRGLGKVMGSSFTEDGLVWDGGALGASVDDAYFHENVSPSASPPHVSALAGRSSVTNLEVR